MEGEDRARLLLGVYTIERESDQNSAVVTFAIIAAALTYVVASTAFLVGRYTSRGYKGIPSAVLLASPLVIVALLSSLVLTVSANGLRGKHLKELERLLQVTVKGEGGETILFPSSVRDASFIWEFRRRLSLPLRIFEVLTVATYFPIILLALGYTSAALIPGPWPWFKSVVFVIYCFVIATQATGLLIASRHPRFRKDFDVN
jgi:hypothetical protein